MVLSGPRRWRDGNRDNRTNRALDGQAACRTGDQPPEGRDLRSGGRRLAGEVFLLGVENALRSRPRDEEALKDEQIKKLKQKIGDLVLDNDMLREALKPYPVDRKTSDA